MRALLLAALALFPAAASGGPADAYLPEVWQAKLNPILEQYPQANKLVQVFVDRLAQPYEMQRACWKESYARGRGLGRSRCVPESEYPDAGGALCYRQCRPGYTSDGVTLCWKSFLDVYSRGAGVTRSCQPNEEDQAALCYPKCPDGFFGVGPVCWKACTDAEYPFYAVDFGAMCCDTREACQTQMFDIAVKFPALWARVVASGLGGNYLGAVQQAKAAVDGAMAFALPVCGDPIFTPLPNTTGVAHGGRALALLPTPNVAAIAPPAPIVAPLSHDSHVAPNEPGRRLSISASEHDTCTETPMVETALTCAQMLGLGSSCSQLVTAGYDCHCTCFDEEVTCWKHWESRGVGWPRSGCNVSSYYPDRGGALCYAECLPGFRSDGASQCHKVKLWPPGNATIYSRGSGADMSCSDGEDEDAGLCYPQCPPGYAGAGPICWRDCDEDSPMPINGGAICCSSAHQCGERVIGLVSGIPFAFANIAATVLEGGALTPQLVMNAAKDLADAINGFRMPMCIPDPAAESPSSPFSPAAGSPSSPSSPAAGFSSSPSAGALPSPPPTPPPTPPPSPPPPAEPAANFLSVQHALQLLPLLRNLQANGTTAEVRTQLLAELANLLDVDPSRFELDMFQPAAQLVAGGKGSIMAAIAFSILPAAPPAESAWALSAALLAHARTAALSALASKSRRRLATQAALFDALNFPLLACTVAIESAFNMPGTELEELGLPRDSSGSLPDFSSVSLPVDGAQPPSWADLTSGLGGGGGGGGDKTGSATGGSSSGANEPATGASTAKQPAHRSLEKLILAGACALIAAIVLTGCGLWLWLRRRQRKRSAALPRDGGVLCAAIAPVVVPASL